MELRRVELLGEHGVWPAHTRGVIVDAFSCDATVEIMDAKGETLDLLTVPYRELAVIDSTHEMPLTF